MLYNINLFKVKQPAKVNLSNPSKSSTATKPMSLSSSIVDPLDGKGKVTSTHLQKRGGTAKGIPIGTNNGIDIAIDEGTPIKSIFSGKVVDVNFHPNGYGHLITIQREDGMQAVYAHMQSKSPLKKGSYVNAGDVIGAVGSSGKATGSHLSLQMGKGQFNPKTGKYILASQATPDKAIDPKTILTNRK